MEEIVPIILLGGMTEDARFFEAQLAAFPNLRIQSWISPEAGESLNSYAARLARDIDPGRPCIVGGLSFGGIVALEAARHLSACACILIGSIRSPRELPWKWRLLRPLAWCGPEVLRVFASVGAKCGRPVLSRATVRRLTRLARPEAAFVRWAMCAVVRWRPSSEANRVPVFQIHGSDDRVLPVNLVQPDVIVQGGAHALTLFNPAAVNDFIADVLRRVEAEATGR